jgi:hypothetical protein
MNRVLDQSPPPGDDLDVLLGSFFKAEMPAPWPPFQAPASSRTLPLNGRLAPRRSMPLNGRTGARHLFGSRGALAASVGLLMLAGLLLGGKFAPSSRVPLPPLPNPGTADPTKKLPLFVPTDVETGKTPAIKAKGTGSRP